MDAKVYCPDGRSFLIGDIVYHEENKANARLIAAAPDLLDACNYALGFMQAWDKEQGNTEPSLVTKILSDAISKAA